MAQTPAADPSSIHRAWFRRLDGYVTDVSVSEHADVALVATIPNPDRPRGARKNYLSFLNGKSGRTVWRRAIKTGIKGQSLSKDGGFMVATTYDDEMFAMDARGKRLWRTTASCRPIVLTAARRVICYHDDDSEPSIAFEVYDWSGKLLLSYPISQDILALKVSSDEKRLLIGLDGGGIVVFSIPRFQVLAEAHVTGEIMDFDIEGDENPVIATAYYSSLPERKSGSNEPKLVIFGLDGKGVTELAVHAPVDQVEFAADSQDLIYLYGNGTGGQSLALYGLTHYPGVDPYLVERWSKGIPYATRYTPLAFPVPSLRKQSGDKAVPGIVAAFEDVGSRKQQNHVVGLSQKDGSLIWDFSPESDEGSYLYVEAYAPRASSVVIATDDGHVGMYRFR